MLKYSLILFDLDGTLIDSRKSIITSLHEAARAMGVSPRNARKAECLIGQPLSKILEKAKFPDVEKGIELYRKSYYEYIDTEVPYEGIKKLLDEIDGQAALVVVTNKGSGGANRTLKQNGLLDYFTRIETVESCENPKPHPECFLNILSYYEKEGIIIPREKCLMVGDSPTDIEFAHRSGIDSAFATWGFFSESDLTCSPTYVLSEPADLVREIEEIVKVEITPELDLHTFLPIEIKRVVNNYLFEAQKKNFALVRIVHGKGTGVQRRIVRSILEKHPTVLRFETAGPLNGGSGATIAELEMK